MTQAPAGWQMVGRLDALDEQYPMRVTIADKDIALCRRGEDVYALANMCSHAYAYLSDGYIEDGELFCPLHDGSFDLRSGDARHPPCQDPIATYPVKVESGDIFIQLTAHGAGRDG